MTPEPIRLQLVELGKGQTIHWWPYLGRWLVLATDIELFILRAELFSLTVFTDGVFQFIQFQDTTIIVTQDEDLAHSVLKEQ